MNNIIYKKSDTWLLLAIIYANFEKNGATLQSIIDTGDYIMHAIFNDDELNEGIDRLLRGNFLIKKNNLFSLTNKTKKLYSQINKKYKTTMKQFEEMQKNLK